ncbi:MAG TPA: PorT family protein [Phaeodactylibacter sp.]|nr:PorT family protein [Phaeodactylibacter sp.]
MNRLIILIVALFLLTTENTKAQDLSYGFRVGLNVSSFLGGDKDVDLNGKEAETISTNTGFHVGGGVRVEFTDLFGIRAELLFTQKGTKRTFDGAAPFIFKDKNGNKILTTGNKAISLNISNAYIDIPVLAYGKIGKKLELFGGVYAGFLVGSVASGELVYTNGMLAGSNNPIDKLDLTLDYNYSKDQPGEIADAVENIEIMVGTETVEVPNTLTAYYDLETKSGKAFKIFDAGLAGGAAFFINNGLYVSAIANYGLVDVSNNDLDFSNAILDKTRNDRDTNLSFQFSIGFSF